MPELLKIILIISAIILTIILWIVTIYAFEHGINLGINGGAEALLAILIIFALHIPFPVVLIVSACKCTNIYSLLAIWIVTIGLYAIWPIKVYANQQYCKQQQQEMIQQQKKTDDTENNTTNFNITEK